MVRVAQMLQLMMMLVTFFSLWVAGVHAEELSESVEPRERTLHLHAQQEARSAIASGQHDAAQLLPLYLSLARASALLHDEDAARAAFIRVLALDAAFRPDAGESDLVRSRYLEARGFWAGQSVPLHAEASLPDQRAALSVEVTDPARMSARVRVRVRCAGETHFSEMVRAPTQPLEVPVSNLASAAFAEYSLTLLDEYGNRLWQRGSDTEPVRLTIREQRALPSETKSASEPRTPDNSARTRFLTLGATSAVLGLAAAGGGAFAQREREQAAQRWNDGTCTGPGSTRATICAGEQRRIERMQRLMGSLYGAAGAALISSLVLFVLTPAREQPPGNGKSTISYRCQQGPGELGLSCVLGF